jgi:hypothetical protein
MIKSPMLEKKIKGVQEFEHFTNRVGEETDME